MRVVAPAAQSWQRGCWHSVSNWPSKAAGGTRGNVYKLVVYLTDIADKEAVSRLRAEFFGPVYPCSTLVQVGALAFPGLTIEIDAFGRLDCDVAQAMQYYPGQYYPG